MILFKAEKTQDLTITVSIDTIQYTVRALDFSFPALPFSNGFHSLNHRITVLAGPSPVSYANEPREPANRHENGGSLIIHSAAS